MRGPLHLATAPALAGVTGRYFDHCSEVELHPVARRPELARQVVERTGELVRAR